MSECSTAFVAFILMVKGTNTLYQLLFENAKPTTFVCE